VPRSKISGPNSRSRLSEFEFGFDFFLPGPYPDFDAFFPHSSHTQWMDCRQCHPRIFPKRGTRITMDDIFKGKYCGECHGKVAFPAATGCERCHTTLVQAEGLAEAALIGNVTMRRVASPMTSAAIADSNTTPAQSLTEVFPVATFPHWVHRIRFRCNVCHMDIFEPRAGANEITMEAIRNGGACGRCHNGKTAFDSGFGNCMRCHVDPASLVEGQSGS